MNTLWLVRACIWPVEALQYTLRLHEKWHIDSLHVIPVPARLIWCSARRVNPSSGFEDSIAKYERYVQTPAHYCRSNSSAGGSRANRIATS